MRLELGYIHIKDVKFGEETKISNGTLTINKVALLEAVAGDERIVSVDIDIVHPGESVRIIPVKDVVEPRVKVKGPGNVFPGMLGKVEMVGEGRTHVLQGMAVVTTGKIVGFQEGIIDMTGPGADYTPFSKLHNVVVTVEPKAGVLQHDHEASVRMIGFKAAAYLAEAGRTAKVDEEKVYEHLPIFKSAEKYASLPKVVYVYMLQTQGLLHDTYVYGVDAKRILPTLMSPTEMFDGAIVSGNCVSACDKNPSIVHENSPVVTDLLERHGKDFNFIGVVITNENVTLADKERSSNFTTKLVEMLGADAVIISEEGFGNPDADLIMNCVKLEKKGVKTVLLTDEYAGRDGASQSLADANVLGNACVTAGNANEVILLPPMAKVIGHPEVADTIAGGWNGSLRKDGSIEAEIQVITGATNEVGYFTLTAKQI